MNKINGILYEKEQVVKCNPIHIESAEENNASFKSKNNQEKIKHVYLANSERIRVAYQISRHNNNYSTTLLAKGIEYDEC